MADMQPLNDPALMRKCEKCGKEASLMVMQFHECGMLNQGTQDRIQQLREELEKRPKSTRQAVEDAINESKGDKTKPWPFPE